MLQWGTDAASPSGLTWIDGTFFMAALGGERLWAIYVDDEPAAASAVEWFTGAVRPHPRRDARARTGRSGC